MSELSLALAFLLSTPLIPSADVLDLVEMMQDKDWRVRAACQKRLERYLPGATPYLREVSRGHSSAEVRHRAGRLVRLEERRICRDRKFPWIDIVQGEISDRLKNHYLERSDYIWGLDRIPGSGYDWGEWRHATYLWVQDQLAGGRPLREVHEILDRLEKAEKLYRRQVYGEK